MNLMIIQPVYTTGPSTLHVPHSFKSLLSTDEDALSGFDASFQQSVSGRGQSTSLTGWAGLRRRGWAVLDDPSSSIWAKVSLSLGFKDVKRWHVN